MGKSTDRTRKRKPVPVRLDVRVGDQSELTREFVDLVRQREGLHLLPSEEFSPIVVGVTEAGGYLHLRLNIQDETTAEQLRQVASLVVALRDRLLEFQGPRKLPGTKAKLYDDLSCLHQGEPLSALTRTINELLAEYLMYYLQFLYDAEDKPGARWCSADQPDYFNGLPAAMQLLRLLGIPGLRSDVEITTFCMTVCCRMSRGVHPYAAVGAPLDESHLRNKLRSWKRCNLHDYVRNH